ncbi:MAG: hypothetical protein HYV40_01760 [Candidatus Levybacteria bacterium]|nr:hypothetical protein [Candidatus Levybacteria bacterium]
MKRYGRSIVIEAQKLRMLGKTYSEIGSTLQLKIPKSTLSHWFQKTPLPLDYLQRIQNLNITNLNRARPIAIEINKIKREKLLSKIERKNIPVAQMINNPMTAKIALAMLYLAEGLNSKKTSSFYFGNSNPIIITIYLQLLKASFPFELEKVRCTVQCRADQDIEQLVDYWSKVSNIPKRLFYNSRIDPRTIGRPTQNKDYKGVLRIDYFNTKCRLELESLANLLYNQLSTSGPEV